MGGLACSGEDRHPEWLCPDRAPVMVPLPGNLPYTLAFNEEGPSDLLFLVHFKHPFPPVTGFLSSIPDSTGPVGVFSPITDSRRWVLIILALTSYEICKVPIVFCYY